MTASRELRRSVLRFHLGLLVFSIPVSLMVFLLLRWLLGADIPSVAAGLSVVAVLQLTAIMYRSGAPGGAMSLRLSFWTLKILQSMRLLSEYAPEKMVVAMNNRKALAAAGGGFRPEKTLILLPHCLQNHQCPIRLTFDPDGCRRCGKCPVGSILDVRDRFGTGFAIASGGTSARRTVEKLRPDLIVAVACPVDLSLGILDVHPITTVGILNQWRNGPCFDTWVDSRELEAALSLFLEGD